MKNAHSWQTRDRFLEMKSHWVTLIGEHLVNERGQILEYWRVERANSVIVLPLQSTEVILMTPSYRPGVGQPTFDFPGGRLPQEQTPEQAAWKILQRELAIEAGAIKTLHCLNPSGWAVDSSFSNQTLYGFVAVLQPSAKIPPQRVGMTVPATKTGVGQLLDVVTCLQCRAVLLEWWNQRALQDSNL